MNNLLTVSIGVLCLYFVIIVLPNIIDNLDNKLVAYNMKNLSGDKLRVYKEYLDNRAGRSTYYDK